MVLFHHCTISSHHGASFSFKKVKLMETNCFEAFQNNVIGAVTTVKLT